MNDQPDSDDEYLTVKTEESSILGSKLDYRPSNQVTNSDTHKEDSLSARMSSILKRWPVNAQQDDKPTKDFAANLRCWTDQAQHPKRQYFISQFKTACMIQAKRGYNDCIFAFSQDKCYPYSKKYDRSCTEFIVDEFDPQIYALLNTPGSWLQELFIKDAEVGLGLIVTASKQKLTWTCDSKYEALYYLFTTSW